MEAVPHFGPPTRKAILPAPTLHAEKLDGAAFDNKIMSRADSIEADMAHLDDLGRETTPAPTQDPALAEKAKHAAAARFFAVNGMESVGHILGDSMSDQDAKKAKEEDAKAKGSAERRFGSS